MNKYFTIGEISSLLHLSSHTLRYYDKIGLLKPMVTNSSNGYRMYAYEQIFSIERIKYLQHIGFNLDEIREIFHDESTETLYRKLDDRKKYIESEISRLESQKKAVENYQQYFNHVYSKIKMNIPYIAHFNERWIVQDKYSPQEKLLGTAGMRLTAKKSRPEYSVLDFQRQIGLMLDCRDFFKGIVSPYSYFMFIDHKPENELPDIFNIPAGDYLCFRTKLFCEGNLIPKLSDYLEADTDSIVLACELDTEMNDDSDSWLHSTFEVQILI